MTVSSVAQSTVGLPPKIPLLADRLLVTVSSSAFVFSL